MRNRDGRTGRIGFRRLAAVAVLLLASGAMGAAEPEGGGHVPFAQWEQVTGDWGGARSALAEKGLTFEGGYIVESTSVWSGGIHERESHRNVLWLDAGLDMEPAIGLKGGTLFTELLYVNRERGGTADAGDFQYHSNIESDRRLAAIYELWYEQLFFGDRLRLKVGKADANYEFNYVESGREFAHSGSCYSPTLFVFPTYPDPAMSVNAFFTALEKDQATLTLGYGLYDGAMGVDDIRTGSRGPSTFFHDDRSNDYFHIAELALAWDRFGSLYGGRLTVGGWWHTGDFARYDGGTDHGTGGFQVVAEQRLTAPGGPESDRGWYVFGQYGQADSQVSEAAQHIAGGVVARGMAPGRPGDSFGLYLSFVDLSDDAIDLEFEPEEEGEVPPPLFTADEFALDAYYRFQVTPAVWLQADLQYIVHPSGDDSIDDAFIGGIRAEFSF